MQHPTIQVLFTECDSTTFTNDNESTEHNRMEAKRKQYLLLNIKVSHKWNEKKHVLLAFFYEQ